MKKTKGGKEKQASTEIAPASQAIKISVSDQGERKRRYREMWLAFAGIMAIAILSWIEFQYLGVNSYLFLVFFNLNFILLLLVMLIVVRNSVKLLLERRRKVLGSRLRTRLVMAFVSLSLFPTAVMFLVSVKFVQTSVDYWFKSQVDNSMKQALEVGQAFYVSAQERLGIRAETIIGQIEDEDLLWGGFSMDALLRKKSREYELSLLGVIGPDQAEKNWNVSDEFKEVWPGIKGTINWESLREQPRFWATFWPGPGADFVVGVKPIDNGEKGYMVLGERIGQGLLYRLDQIVRGVDEYQKLKTLKQPIKVALSVIMGVLSLLIVMAAIWFGFRLAKELSAPIQALAEGTQRIAKGDLAVRLEDQSADEFGVLVHSFNRMAEDLEQSRKQLTEANERLGLQNVELERRGDYIAAVLENIAAGVVSLDDKGRIGTMNKAASAILGLDGKSYLGRSPEKFLRGEHARLLDEVLKQLKSDPDSQWQRQMDLMIGDQEKKLLINVVTLSSREGGRAGQVAVFEDISELDKMQRMAAWREVARRIAHEIKNPLTPIKLSAQRLERKFADQVQDKVFTECTELIVSQVEHLQQMVTEFSAFAKLPEVELKFDYLAPLLEEVVALFKNSHSHIEWSLDFRTEIPRMRLDREAVRRAMINVMNNAAEVLEEEENGRVQVIASHDRRQAKVTIEIRDNGPGLTYEVRSRLFEPYFSRKKGGTGLGLTIVKSIISDHYGYIRALPSPDKGTRLVIELPCKAAW